MPEMQADWTDNQRKLIEWRACPRYERIPPTQEMLAASIGVDPATLTRWTKLPGFQDEVNILARQSIGAKLPEVYGALLRQAEAGSFEHIRLTLELSGDYVKQQKNFNEDKGEVTLIVKTEGVSTIQPHLTSGTIRASQED